MEHFLVAASLLVLRQNGETQTKKYCFISTSKKILKFML